MSGALTVVYGFVAVTPYNPFVERSYSFEEMVEIDFLAVQDGHGLLEKTAPRRQTENPEAVKTAADDFGHMFEGRGEYLRE